jgi:hypothetical protein
VDLTGAFNVQFNGNGGGPAANTGTLDSLFTGTLTVNSVFTVANGLEVDGGNIAQPGGVGVSDIKVNGLFDWSNGGINTTNVAGILELLNGTANITGTNLTLGSTYVQDTGTTNLNITGTLTFKNTNPLNNMGSGITINGGAFYLLTGGQSIVRDDTTDTTGTIENNGGQFSDSAPNNTTVTCKLPYHNNNASAVLKVTNVDTLTFTRNVNQSDGLIWLISGATLGAQQGLIMSGGNLKTTGAGNIVGAFNIHGGTVAPGDGTVAGNIGKLFVDGAVDMDGGTYLADVDLSQGGICDLWQATTFNLHNTATLTVNSLNVPAHMANPLAYTILTAATKNGITGDFATKNLTIPGTGGKAYTWVILHNPNSDTYQLNSPTW